MRSHIFDLLDPISIIGFLSIYNLAYNTNGVREVVEIWLFNFFMDKLSSAVLNTSLGFKQAAQTRLSFARKTALLSKYPRVVGYSLRSYATYENIADTENEILLFPQPPNKTPL